MSGGADRDAGNPGDDAAPYVAGLACGCSHTVAVLSDGTLASWGRGEDGQLGHGDAGERHLPAQITALKGNKVTMISAGSEHTIVVSDEEGEAWSWGWGDFGRLGHGNPGDVFVPQRIASLSGVRIAHMACGDMHSILVTQGGDVLSFGRNQNGQLGLGSREDALVPTAVAALKGKRIAQAGCGAEHTVVCTADGEAYSWGWNAFGNLGVGDTSDRLDPTLVKGFAGTFVEKVACGWRHSIAVDKEGAVHTFGWSKYGQLGHGDHADHWVPKRLEALRAHGRVELVAGGWRHTAAAMEDGHIFTWGWNKFGQLGISTTNDMNAPSHVAAIASEKVHLISCGWRHTVVSTSQGNTYSWGRGANGQLGLGMTADVTKPMAVAMLHRDAVGGLAESGEPGPGYLPPSDRYAVVPEPNAGGGGGGDMDVPCMPNPKRMRN